MDGPASVGGEVLVKKKQKNQIVLEMEINANTVVPICEASVLVTRVGRYG